MSAHRIVLAFCVMFLPSLTIADEFTEQAPVEENRPIRKLIKKLIGKPRKCFKCSGEGNVVMNVKEPYGRRIKTTPPPLTRLSASF